ncbi:MAG: outer membrane beta-barrel protein [Candidatus Aminicenantes bacterium]|nr:outer membrane beta-barrel protein [Candidatus Aminicenantes bacterium]
MLFLFFFLFLAPIAEAKKFKKGVIELSGGSGFLSSIVDLNRSGGTKTERDTSLLDLEGVYYIDSEMGFGFSMIRLRESTIAGDVEDKMTEDTFGPLMKYNVQISKKFGIKALIHLFQSEKDSSFSNGATSTLVDVTGWQIGGGLSYYLSDSVSINFTLNYREVSGDSTGYTSGVETGSDNYSENGVITGAGVSLYFN